MRLQWKLLEEHQQDPEHEKSHSEVFVVSSREDLTCNWMYLGTLYEKGETFLIEGAHCTDVSDASACLEHM